MLQRIVSYSDSDNDGVDDEVNIENSTNMPLKGHHNELSSRQTESDTESESRSESESEDIENNGKKKKKTKSVLPLPSSINKLYGGCEEGVMNNKAGSNKHQGRKRTFDHVEGNWATFIFFPPALESNNLSILHEKVCLTLKKKKLTSKLHFTPLKDCHLTISRTVPVRHYWMDTIFTMLKEKFAIKNKFYYSITGLEVYTNDDASRTFVSLKVDTSQTLLDSVTMVDDIFKEFDLPVYYKEPSFHISIAWCLGNHKDSLSELMNADIVELFSNFQGHLGLNLVSKVCVKFGNKLQQVELL